MTEKLFYDNPTLCDFTAEIIEKEKTDKGWRIQLDRTAFYPEGGGQPADRGSIDGLEVYDVQKEGNLVFHYLENLPESESVTGHVNWDHRFEYMQQHTGQHILSTVLKRITDSATVAVHQAQEYTSIEIDHSDFSIEQIELIEEAANGLVCANQPVHSYLNGKIPISSFPIRRDTKFTENVRLVQIGGVSLENASEAELQNASVELEKDLNVLTSGLKDLAACGGVHTTRTGEVGLIKFKGQEKVRGRLRLFFLIGNRAYRDYRMKTDITDKISEVLSVSVDGILREFERFSASLGEEKKRNSDLLKEMALLKAEEIKNENRAGRKTFLFNDVDPAYFKKIIISLSSFSDIHLCLLNIKGENGQWGIVSTGVQQYDYNLFRNEILPLVDGKGGGKAPLWQGKLGNCTKIEEFLKKFSDSLS